MLPVAHWRHESKHVGSPTNGFVSSQQNVTEGKKKKHKGHGRDFTALIGVVPSRIECDETRHTVTERPGRRNVDGQLNDR